MVDLQMKSWNIMNNLRATAIETTDVIAWTLNIQFYCFLLSRFLAPKSTPTTFSRQFSVSVDVSAAVWKLGEKLLLIRIKSQK